jgi:hypothetical protein
MCFSTYIGQLGHLVPQSLSPVPGGSYSVTPMNLTIRCSTVNAHTHMASTRGRKDNEVESVKMYIVFS